MRLANSSASDTRVYEAILTHIDDSILPPFICPNDF